MLLSSTSTVLCVTKCIYKFFWSLVFPQYFLISLSVWKPKSCQFMGTSGTVKKESDVGSEDPKSSHDWGFTFTSICLNQLRSGSNQQRKWECRGLLIKSGTWGIVEWRLKRMWALQGSKSLYRLLAKFPISRGWRQDTKKNLEWHHVLCFPAYF